MFEAILRHRVQALPHPRDGQAIAFGVAGEVRIKPINSAASIGFWPLAGISRSGLGSSTIPRFVNWLTNRWESDPRRMPCDVVTNEYFGQINYSGSHEQSLINVVARQADAAFISSTTFNAFNKRAQENANRLQILWRSRPIPRDPFVLRDALCPNIKKKIKDVFLKQKGASNTELLRRLSITRFIPVTDADYQILHDLP